MRPHASRLLVGLGLSPGLFHSALGQGNADRCQRSGLRNATDMYLESLAAGVVDPTHAGIRYAENNRDYTLGRGTLNSKPLNTSRSFSVFDQAACASYTELVVRGPTPYVVGVQLRFFGDDAAGEPVRARLVDVVVTGAGDYNFDAGRTLDVASRVDWTPVPSGAQDPREVLQAGVDAYLDRWGWRAEIGRPVPWGTPCGRLEGSVFTPDSCATPTPDPAGPVVIDRRYVIDPALGAVHLLATLDNAPSSYLFRLVQGKLVYVSVMAAKPVVRA